MQTVMRGLFDQGRQHARREIRSMGASPVEGFAEEDDEPRLHDLFRALLTIMTGMAMRLRREGEALHFEVNRPGGPQATTEQLAKILEQRVPGARDAAGRIVSGTFDLGLGNVYEQNEHLFPCWHYTAIMDANTCGPCRDRDGDEYANLTEAFRVMPNFGPNPLCLGDGRCRCRLVPCPPDAESGQAPPEPAGRPGAEALPPGPGDEKLRKHRMAQDSAWAADADWRGLTLDEYRAELQQIIDEEMSDQEVRIRAPGSVIEEILGDGRFKSQFESGRSGGAFDPDFRRRFEQRFFGYDPPDEQRPIYGYLSVSEGRTSSYGGIVFKLKRKVRTRATFTVDDSLGGGEGNFFSAPVEEPTTDVFTQYVRRGGQRGPLSDLHVRHGGDRKSWLRSQGFYVEAQIHGGVTLDDVEEVVFEESSWFLRRTEEITQAFQALGIVVRWNESP